MRIVFSELRQKFGVLGIIPFSVKMFIEQRRLKKRYPAVIKQAQKFGPETANEFLMMTAMFNVIATQEGRAEAYEFLKGMFQKVAVYSMPAIYQLDDLVRCEGDVFDNFKKFNIAMFEAIDKEGTWKSEEIIDEADKLTIKVVSCANVDLFAAMDCPELTKLGCDHDLAGYPLIEDKVKMEFRRPCTLAKGDSYCNFMFYRQGTAPATAHLNK